MKLGALFSENRPHFSFKVIYFLRLIVLLFQRLYRHKPFAYKSKINNSYNRMNHIFKMKKRTIDNAATATYICTYFVKIHLVLCPFPTKITLAVWASFNGIEHKHYYEDTDNVAYLLSLRNKNCITSPLSSVTIRNK